jgi:UV DNA damage endonuclease
MHPGQYNQVGANTDKVFDSTIDDLSHQADILNAMGMDGNSVMIVHGGGTYGDKKQTMIRWVRNFQKLPEKVRKRLVIENCERCYSLQDVLIISRLLKKRGFELPVIFDSHHYECNEQLYGPQYNSLEKDIEKVIESWGSRKVLMHVSNQGEGRVGHHSDYITRFPDIFFYIRDKLNVSIDLEVEAKKKEQAIFALRKLHPSLC